MGKVSKLTFPDSGARVQAGVRWDRVVTSTRTRRTLCVIASALVIPSVYYEAFSDNTKRAGYGRGYAHASRYDLWG